MTRNPTTKRTAHETIVVNELTNLVHGITTPFACGGSLVPEAPIMLHFKDGTELGVTRRKSAYEQKSNLTPLINRCSPAPFGHGKKTQYHREIRDALQLKAERGAFTVKNFDPQKNGILNAIRQELAPDDPNPLLAELYNVNVYGPDGHFKPHKDTPRGDNMMGTLVVCLPSQFSNGKLVITHRGAHKVFDWSEDIRQQKEPSRVYWAAFFGDVDHSIQKIWSGERVTLSYILRRGEGVVPAPVQKDPQTELLRQRLSTALSDRRFLPLGGILGLPCFHMYSQESKFQKHIDPLTEDSARKLKGRDQHIARAAIQEGLSVLLQPYLVETCADETWQLNHFPPPGVQHNLDDQIDPEDLERVLPIAAAADDVKEFGVTWIVPPPQFNCAPIAPKPMSETATENPDPDFPAIRYFHTCEYSATGYFGNEGSETEFYVYAALHVIIPPFGKGPRK